MKTINKTYLLILLFVKMNSFIYCQNISIDNPFRAISMDGSHFILTEVTVNPNSNIKLYITNKDSSYNYILLNDSVGTFNKIIIATEEYISEANSRFTESKIILQPQIVSGLYSYVYESNGKKYILKFFYIK